MQSRDKKKGVPAMQAHLRLFFELYLTRAG